MSALLEAARSVWPFDNDPLDMGVEDDIVWAVCRAPYSGVNGYVLIPAEGHPWSGGVPRLDEKYDGYVGYATEDLTVHGGITYGAGGDARWIGFDTAHGGDIWSGEFDRSGFTTNFTYGGASWEKRWTLDLVVEEAKGLARQLAAIGA